MESYTYDYAGNRTSKTVNEGGTTYYVTDTGSSLSQVVAEVDGDGRETASYTLGDERISVERDGKIWYYLHDGHGSVRMLAGEDGQITDSYSYDAYGNLLEREGDTENDFLYTGEQYNANTGLYYLRARYMNPDTGTFISMDSYPGSSKGSCGWFHGGRHVQDVAGNHTETNDGNLRTWRPGIPASGGNQEW